MLKQSSKFILLIILFCFVVFLIVFYQLYFWQYFVKDRQLIRLVLKDNVFASPKKELLVEVVKDESSVRQGLSSRSQLQTVDGQTIDGMLFIFPETKIRQFWMKDMQFDIDICWFKKQALVACTRKALKPNSKIDEDLTIYQSPQEIDIVLETKPDLLPEELLEARLYPDFF